MKNILIIEDNEDHLKIVKIILEQHNYTVTVAKNGRQGLELAQKLHPHLVILDVMIPEMNGYEVSRQIKTDPYLKNIPIIMLSVNSGKEDVESGYKSGANIYMSKPFNLEELIANIKNLLGVE